ncbi:hypothetical protein N9Y63_07900 [Akkermansiaceae bacterium]|nr:hypothetical protein [Akkermansiaceae bacterium]MDB2640768.1 hypothetical protein [Akkermansiaceae bacterium]MDB4622417.1 hypothetical protein [Akkermansiaceae bacterium]MDB4772078.1 hypothetical protein [Akkermansiaceae bacterium]
MQKIFIPLFISAILGLLVSCNPKEEPTAETGPDGNYTHASLLEDMVNLVEELGSLLETVDDAASAKDANPKIEKISKRMAEINKSMEEIESPNKEIVEKLPNPEKYEARMEKGMEKGMEKMNAEMKRLAANPEVRRIISESMDNFGE